MCRVGKVTRLPAQCFQDAGKGRIGRGVEEDEVHEFGLIVLGQEIEGRRQGNPGGLIHWVAIRASAQGGKGDAAAAVLRGQFQAAAIGAVSWSGSPRPPPFQTGPTA